MPRLPGDAVRLTFWKVLTGTRLLPYEPMINRNAEAVLSALAPVHDGILIAPPSYLQLLSRLIIDAGRERAVRPRVVFYNGEQMSDDIRKMTVRAFGAPIFSRYGANEFSAMVIQSCPHDGWHINTEGFIVEIVDGAPGDRQAHPASHGRILITDLRNAVAPFIRYEIGDIGWSTGQTACSCGRTSPVLGGLEGRAVEYLVTASGRRIPAVVFQRWLRVQVDCFWEYQLQQDRPGELEIRVVPRQTYTDAQAEALVAHLRQFLGDEVSVRVKAVEGIPREASGKRPLLKSTLRIP
jgi:phenylacetate-CoA ligase